MLMTELFEGGDEGEAEFAFTVAGVDEAAGEEEARRIMYRVREQALLDPNVSRLLVLTPAEARRDQRPLGKAETLLELGRHEEAVVFSHIACEARATEAVRELLQSVAPPWLVAHTVRKATDLTEPWTQRVFFEVSGSKIQEQQEWWSDYKEHVKRRHRVVHDAAVVSSEEARASVRVAYRFISFVDAVLSR